MQECCGNIFQEFESTFKELTKANPPIKLTPPNNGGVYIIRIRERGKDSIEVLNNARAYVDSFQWENTGLRIKKMLLNDFERLERINNCNTIYIGKAGTLNNPRPLFLRYDDLWWGHTMNWPIRFLVEGGWKLEYGWREVIDPFKEEYQYKELYKRAHDGKLPALVKR